MVSAQRRALRCLAALVWFIVIVDTLSVIAIIISRASRAECRVERDHLGAGLTVTTCGNYRAVEHQHRFGGGFGEDNRGNRWTVERSLVDPSKSWIER